MPMNAPELPREYYIKVRMCRSFANDTFDHVSARVPARRCLVKGHRDKHTTALKHAGNDAVTFVASKIS